MSNRFVLNRQEGKVLGVAAGLSDYTGVDVLLIRLAMVGLAIITFPIPVLFYILTGWLAADQ